MKPIVRQKAERDSAIGILTRKPTERAKSHRFRRIARVKRIRGRWDGIYSTRNRAVLCVLRTRERLALRNVRAHKIERQFWIHVRRLERKATT